MNRDYSRSFLLDLIRGLHERIPALSIGADVIVGFPGETEERFKQTYELVESLPISYLHVFPFSKRKGTAAYHFPKCVDEAEIKKRAEIIRGLGKRKRKAFYQKFLDQELSILVEDRREKGTDRWRGFSRNYIPVSFADGSGSEGPRDWINREWTVRVTGFSENEVIGKVLER